MPFEIMSTVNIIEKKKDWSIIHPWREAMDWEATSTDATS
jgi:hypothetical protein